MKIYSTRAWEENTLKVDNQFIVLQIIEVLLKTMEKFQSAEN